MDQLHEPTVKAEGLVTRPNQEAWQNVPSRGRLCQARTDMLPWQRQMEAQAIVNSVYMLFHAFRRLVDISCQGMSPATNCRDQLRGALLHQELTNSLDLMFTHRVEAPRRQPRMTENTFSLINVQQLSLVAVGTWEGSWDINDGALRWGHHFTRAPASTCGGACGPGHIRVPKDGSSCCWTCASCSYKQVVKDNYTCADCARGYWPSRDYRKCEFQWKRTLLDCFVAWVAMVLVFSLLVL